MTSRLARAVILFGWIKLCPKPTKDEEARNHDGTVVHSLIMIDSKYLSGNLVKARISSSENPTFSGATTSVSSFSFVL